MAVLTNTMLQGTAADTGGAEGYLIEKSIQFKSADTPYLTTVNTGAGNRRTWTFSCWFKYGVKQSAGLTLFSAGPSSNRTYLFLTNDDELRVDGGGQVVRKTNPRFRDHSAWYNVVAVADTLNDTEDDRFRLYVNGKRITDFATNTAIAQNWDGMDVCTSQIHNIGKNSETGATEYWDGYIADPQLIDGLALSPAAFGSFDESNCWNPKEFSLPAPNKGVTYSSEATLTNVSNAGHAFDVHGDSTFAAPTTGNQLGVISLDTPIVGSHLKIRIGGTQTGYLYINGQPVHNWGANSYGFYNKYGYISLKEIKWGNDGGTSGAMKLMYIEIDGVRLVEGQSDPTIYNNPNDGTTWSSLCSGSTGSGNGHDQMFDGRVDTKCEAASGQTVTFIPTTTITANKSIRVMTYSSGSPAFKVNNVTQTGMVNNAVGWHTLSEKTINTTHGISMPHSGGSDRIKLYIIEVDGIPLLDSKVNNSFHLKFNDTTHNRYLGKDSFNGKISDATGALPIYNTDATGDVKTSGYRTDSLESNLIFAYPGDTSRADVSNSINSSSYPKGTGVGAGAEQMSEGDQGQSRFYGSSCHLDGKYQNAYWGPGTWDDDASGLADFNMGSGDFCAEGWLYLRSVTSAAPVIMHGHISTADAIDWKITVGASNEMYMEGFYGGSSTTLNTGNNTCPFNQWVHFAYTRTSNKIRAFVNGVEKASATISGALDNDHDSFKISGFNIGGTYRYLNGNIQDIRVYKGAAKYSSNFKPPTRRDFSVINLPHDKVVKTADATGAKPVLVTTGDYGGGTTDAANTDSDASSLLICLSGKSLTEVEPTGRTAATRTWSTSGNAAISTDSSRFYGSAFKFDGTGDYISSPDSTDFDMGSNPYTIEAWINPNNLTHHGVIAGQWQDGSVTTCAYALQLVNGQPRLVIGEGSNVKSCISPIKIAAGEWSHIAGTYDGTNLRCYVNGTLMATLAWTAGTNNGGPDFHLGAALHGSAGNWSRGTYFNGYIQDVRVYKNLVKYRGDFTVTSEGNSWSNTSLTDSPSTYDAGEDGKVGEVRGNHCTLNPLDKASNSTGGLTFKDCNLYAETTSSSGQWSKFRGTLGVPKGSTDKFYYEVIFLQDTGNTDLQVGWTEPDRSTTGVGFGDFVNEYCFRGDNGKFFHAGSQHAYGNAPSQGDVIGVGYDNGAIRFFINGTEQNSGTAATTGINKLLVPGFGLYCQSSDTIKVAFNFGQRPFKYLPTGYKSLCSQNLEDLFSGDEVNNPSKYFDVKTYIGTGVAQTLKGYNFGPDYIVSKRRESAGNWETFDQIRGVQKPIYWNSNNAEEAKTHSLTAFNSDGFTMGDGTGMSMNAAGGKYVTYGWDAGTAAVGSPGSSGNMTASVQWVNATAGFSISKVVKPDGTSNQTFEHGLGAKPSIVLNRRYDVSEDWYLYTSAIDGSHDFIQLNSSGAKGDTGLPIPTNSLASTMDAAGNYIVYCWTPIPGFSSFGTYSGQSFVHTNFRPRWVWIKSTAANNEWHLHTTEPIDERNPVVKYLRPALNNVEDGSSNLDILSNGFYPRTTGTWITDTTMFYMAFAEHPFKTARSI